MGCFIDLLDVYQPYRIVNTKNLQHVCPTKLVKLRLQIVPNTDGLEISTELLEMVSKSGIGGSPDGIPSCRWARRITDTIIFYIATRTKIIAVTTNNNGNRNRSRNATINHGQE